jgi:dienelactone hydrolase
VVVFLHGSSGLSLKAIAEWQAWLASLGVASIAPDSFALPDRVTYKSPISQAAYEQMHALRASEIALALDALQSAPWADTSRLVLAGTSEGAPSVARYGSAQFVGRMLFAWSCEDNYFVQEHRTAVVPNQAVLNIISTVDPFFSSANTWLGNAQAKGHCAEAFKSQAQTSIVLIPGAPHTLLNLPAAKHAVAGYVAQVLKP